MNLPYYIMTVKPSQAVSASASGNRTLNSARRAKQDEFYTQLGDISNELKHYKARLRGKTVFCNCDDPFESNFFKYFALNFNTLGIRKLVATSYRKSPIVGAQLPLLSIEGLKPEGKEPYAIEINEVPDQNGDGATDLADVEYLLQHNANTARSLQGDGAYNGGDFRSRECAEFLKQADIVITNPPFSLFREYVAQLVAHDKKFLIIGNKNAITYKEIFKLIKENKVWIGVTPMGVDMLFDVPEEYAKTMIASGKEGSNYKIVNGVVKGRSSSIWFTNMDNPKRHAEIPLYKKYTPAEYPTYDNYDAIEIGKVAEIPVDYDGVMGVPITFLDKYNPEQFEILGMCENRDLYGLKTRTYTTKECQKAYLDLFGKKGTYDLNAAGVIGGRKVYQRLLIRRKT
jgi:hypothetical protein